MASTTHISGIVSGIDTATYIEQMLEVEQTKIDNKGRDVTRNEWKLEAYNELYKQIQSFKEKYFTTMGDSSLFSSKAYNTYSVAMASNTSVSIKADGNIAMETLDIVSASKATSASFSTSSGLTSSLKAVSSASLKRAVAYGETTGKDMSYTFADADAGSFTIGSNTYSITAGQTVQQLANTLAADGYSLTFDSANSTFTLASDNGKAFTLTDTDGKFSELIGIDAGTVSATQSTKLSLSGTVDTDAETLAAGTYTFKINDTELSLTVNDGDTNSEIIQNLKTAIDGSGLNVQLNVNSATGAVSLASTNDKATSLKLEGDTGGKLFGESGLTGIASGTRTVPAIASDMVGTHSIAFSVSGGSAINVDITLDADDTYESAAKKIASAIDGVSGVSMAYDSLRGTFTLSADSGVTSLNITDAGGKIFGANSLTSIAAGEMAKTEAISTADSIGKIADKVGGVKTSSGTYEFTLKSDSGTAQTFEFSETDTLSTVMSKINQSSLNVQMTYSQINDSFKITNKGTGAATSLAISGSGFAALGITSSAGEVSTSGTDAVLELKVDGGETRTVTNSSNTFTMDGVAFTVTDDYTGADPLRAAFTYNASKVVENVKSFITDYNAIIDKISGYMTEERDYDYKPLTDKEKDEMSDDEIEKWEAKAKAGLLRDDDTFSSILSSLRSTVYTVVGSTGLSGQSLGITTKTYTTSAGTQYGQLELNEDTLTSALNDNVGKVMTVLAGQEEGSKGLFVRMNTLMTNFTKTMKSSKIVELASDIDEMEDNIEDMYTKMYEKEDDLWSMFGRFESTYSQYQYQSQLLQSYFG